MKKLYLGGCPFGAGNIGDDAILSSLVNNFGINDNELTICISAHSNNSDYINEYISKKSRNIIAYKNKSYSKPILGISLNSNRYPIQGIVNHYLNKKKIRNKDLLICGGGTLVTDMPWHMVKVLDIAQSQNVPAILFGVGMAEIKDKSTLHKLTKTLNLL
ncbi:MAG: polysaccharide pyruvyl transferase family protein, partial [Spirosoma sp.]